MKTVIFFLIAIMIAFAVVPASAQKSTMANYTDTVVNADIHYYPATYSPENFYGSFQILFDHITGSTDSTHVTIQGSIDGTNYMNLNAATSYVVHTNDMQTTFKTVAFLVTDASFIWNIATSCTLPYYRYKVQHYATGTIRVKGWLFKKRP